MRGHERRAAQARTRRIVPTVALLFEAVDDAVTAEPAAHCVLVVDEIGGHVDRGAVDEHRMRLDQAGGGPGGAPVGSGRGAVDEPCDSQAASPPLERARSPSPLPRLKVVALEPRVSKR